MLAVNGKCCINVRNSYIQTNDAHTAFYHLYDSHGVVDISSIYVEMFKRWDSRENANHHAYRIKNNKKAYQMLAVYSQIENLHWNTEF